MKKFLMMMCMCLGMMACTSADDEIVVTPNVPIKEQVVSLAKPVIARCASSDIVLDNSGLQNGHFVTDLKNNENEMVALQKKYPNKPADITSEETTKVKEAIVNNNYKVLESFEHYNYYIQYVGGSSNASKMNQYTLYDQEGNGYEIPNYNGTSGNTELVGNLKITGASYNESSNGVSKDIIKDADLYKFMIIDNQLYLGFDYDNTLGNNQNPPLIHADGVYDDYIIKVTPGCGTIEHEPIVSSLDNAVETNLSIQVRKDSIDADGKLTYETKTSVHVRAITDFEMFIPVPREFYIEQDDLAIIKDHKNVIYKEKDFIQEIVINNNVVTISTSYSDDGILIKSEGINKEVIDYLDKTFHDGLTVEVYNYYNSYNDVAALKKVLDDATIVCGANHINTVNSTRYEYDKEGQKVLINKDTEEVVEYYTIEYIDGKPVVTIILPDEEMKNLIPRMVPNNYPGTNVLLDCTVTKK